jgi:hypothetical protein
MGAGTQGRQVLNDINQNYSGFSKGWDDIVGQVNTGAAEGKRVTDETREGTRKATTDNIDAHKDRHSDAEYRAGQEYIDAGTQYAYAMGANDYEAMGIDPATAKWLASNGITPDMYVAQAEARKAGDFLDPSDEVGYNALIDLGRTPGDTLDYTRSGRGADDIFQIDDKKYGAGQTAYDLITGNEKEAAAKNQERAQSTGAIRAILENPAANPKAFNDTLKKLGITKAEYDWAIENGIDPTKYLNQGDKWDAGDAASDAERKALAQVAPLLAAMGYDVSTLLNDNGVRGDAWTFDIKGFRKALPPTPVIKSSGTAPIREGDSVIDDGYRAAQTSSNKDPVTKAIKKAAGVKW